MEKCVIYRKKNSEKTINIKEVNFLRIFSVCFLFHIILLYMCIFYIIIDIFSIRYMYKERYIGENKLNCKELI